MTEEVVTARDGSVFEWQYVDSDPRSKGSNPYWCCSRFGVYKDGYVVDTYWSTNDGRSLKLSDGGVVFRYLGNLDDYRLCNSRDVVCYADADVLDLRHANGGLLYVKKGAVSDRDKMLAVVEGRLEEARAEVRAAESKLERARSLWMELKCGTPLDKIHL